MGEAKANNDPQASLIPEDRLPEIFRAIVCESPMSTWIADRNGTLVLHNQANRDMFGIESDEEVVGKYNIFRDEEIIRQGFAPQVRRVFENGGSTEFIIDYDFSQVKHVTPAHPTHRILRVFLFAIRDASSNIQHVVVQHEDYTEKARAERELSESRARYQDLLENISDWVWEVDLDARYTYSNPVVERVLGYKPEQVIGRSAFEFILHEDHSKVRSAVQKAVRTKSGFAGVVHRMNHEDGSIRIIESSGRPRFNDDGEVIGFRGIDRDVTERVRAEQALEESQERYRELVENVSDWVWEVDTEGRYTYASPVAHRLLGYTPEEIVGKTPFDFIVAEDRKQVEQAFQEAIRTRSEIKALLNRNRRKDGCIVHLETSGRPIFDDEGNLKGYRGIDRDITEREHAVEALRDSEALLRTLVESLPFDVWSTDADGRYMLQNCTSIRHWGDAVGKHVGELDIPEVVKQAWLEKNRRALAGEVIRGEAEYTHNGETRCYYGVVAPIVDAGKILGTVGVNIDITELKETEARLRRSESEIRALVLALPDVILKIDSEGRYLTVPATNPRLLYRPAEELVGRTIPDVFPKEQADSFMTAIHGALDTGHVVHIQYSLQIEQSRIWFDAAISPMDEDTVIWVARDVTAFKEYEEELKYRAEFENVITSIASGFVALPAEMTDGGIDRALKLVGEFIGADRSFIFMLTPDGKTAANTHEWCAPGVECQIARLQGLRLDDLPLLKDGLMQPEPTQIPDVSRLPERNRNERELLQSEDVKSLLALPMMLADRPIGFLGFETVRSEKEWSEEAVALLQIVGQVFVNALERKRAQEQLREAEAKYRSLVEESLVGVYIIENQHMAYANPRLAEIFGYMQEEVIGKPVADFVAAEDRNKVLDNVQKRLTGEVRSVHYMFKGLKKDGTIIDVEALGTRTTYRGRTAIIGTLMDVTERARSERSLRRSEARFRAVFNYAPAAIAIYNRDAEVLDVNRAFERITGYSGEQIVGKSMFETFARPEDRKRTMEVLDQVFRGEAVEGVEWKDIRADGTPIYVLTNITPLFNELGTVIVALALGIDITERKQAEEKRFELEEHKREFYRRTLAAATEGKLIVTERSEIDRIAGSVLEEWDIENGADLSIVRAGVMEIAHEAGMDEDRIYDFVLAIGEATTNAYKHAGSGQASIHRTDHALMCVVTDLGTGIEALTLPEVALVRGYSTAGTLGMGYKAILSVADRVYLATGPEGTTVGIEMAIHAAEKTIEAARVPDTWAD